MHHLFQGELKNGQQKSGESTSPPYTPAYSTMTKLPPTAHSISSTLFASAYIFCFLAVADCLALLSRACASCTDISQATTVAPAYLKLLVHETSPSASRLCRRRGLDLDLDDDTPPTASAICRLPLLAATATITALLFCARLSSGY